MSTFWYSSSRPDARTMLCAVASMAVTVESARSSTSCAAYQSAGLTYQPERSSSDRRYVLDSGGRPNGIPGSALMITIGPPKPSSWRVAAAVPPASPPPTITIGLAPVPSAMCHLLPKPHTQLHDRRASRGRGGQVAYGNGHNCAGRRDGTDLQPGPDQRHPDRRELERAADRGAAGLRAGGRGVPRRRPTPPGRGVCCRRPADRGGLYGVAARARAGAFAGRTAQRAAGRGHHAVAAGRGVPATG